MRASSSPPSGRGRSTPTTTTWARARSRSSRRRWSRRRRRTTSRSPSRRSRRARSTTATAASRAAGAGMARILLGVTAGIAAYKALELTRLATKAGHAVRVIQTEAATRFVGPASFAGITGAPVLVTEWEPDPLRGAFPGDPAPAHAPLSHLALVERADCYVIAPATAQTIAK